MTRAIELTVCLTLLAAAPALGQSRPQTPPPPPRGVAPQPVGRPDTPATTPQTPPVSSETARPVPPPTAPTAAPRGEASHPALPADPVPTAAQLGLPVYPGARFLRSFDAGQGQRYYLFGSTASFAELVLYYRTQLRDRGDLVYDVPPVHMFEVGRFREETMAFPPGVTIKDYTWGGSKGYLVPTPGADPSRYPTIIQIVPVVGTGR
ncbi:MAG: hypothetical protein IT182_02255 [Acidobacteria bacterium]|nr:hypothetical protein [Acidobacteriota bacterium]